MAKWIDFCAPSEIAESECKVIDIEQTPIAVFNLGGMFYAIQDNCPHQHLPLADGMVIDNTITCPFHGAMFDIITGAVLSPPACEDLTTYQVRLNNGILQVEI